MTRTSPTLTPDQQADADRILATLQQVAQDDLRALANQLASTTDATIFGENEFTLRDIVHRLAAKGLQIALEERKKGGTTAPAASANAAPQPRNSNAGSPKPS